MRDERLKMEEGAAAVFFSFTSTRRTKLLVDQPESTSKWRRLEFLSLFPSFLHWTYQPLLHNDDDDEDVVGNYGMGLIGAAKTSFEAPLEKQVLKCRAKSSATGLPPLNKLWEECHLVVWVTQTIYSTNDDELRHYTNEKE